MNPYFLFGLLGLGGAGLVTVVLYQFMNPIAAWLAAINLRVSNISSRQSISIIRQTATEV